MPTVICALERLCEALVNHTMLVSGARRTSYPGAGAHSSDLSFEANSTRFDEVRPNLKRYGLILPVWVVFEMTCGFSVA